MSPLVLGAGGFLGLNLIDSLQRRGVNPRAGSRRRAPRRALRQRGVEVVRADLEDLDSLALAMEGAPVVFHLAGHYPKLSTTLEETVALGLRQTGHVLEAAARAGVQRLIYVSSTATVAPAPGRASHEGDRFAEPPGFGVYHDLKWRLEALVEAETRVQTLTVCPGACLGPFDQRVGTTGMLVAVAMGRQPPHPHGVVNLVDARDVGDALTRLAELGDPPRRTLLAGGDYDLHELMTRLSARYGAPPPTPALSDEAALALANAEERRCEREGGRPSLNREIADLAIHGVAIDTTLAREALDITFRPLDDTLSAFEAWARKARILPKQSRSSTCQTSPTVRSSSTS